MRIRTRLGLLCFTAALVAACGTPDGGRVAGDPATADPGAIIGEVGDGRQRARLHTELASLYYSRGNMGVALDELRIATASDPGYAPAFGMFGVVYQELKENRLAEEAFARALSLAPTDPDINHNFGLFLCQNRREQDSIKYFMAAIRNPLYATPWRSYAAAGQCTMRTNNLKDAEEFLQRALKLDPDDPAATLHMGHVRYRQGALDDARRYVSRFNKLANPTAESLWLALRIERRKGQRVAETSYANQLRRRFPRSPEYQALQRGDFD